MDTITFDYHWGGAAMPNQSPSGYELGSADWHWGGVWVYSVSAATGWPWYYHDAASGFGSIGRAVA